MAGTAKPRALKRSMRMMGVLLLTLSAVTPASSIFVSVPEAITKAGSGAFLGMAVAAFLSIPIAYVYSELASAFPIAGGEYSMVGRAAGAAAGFATFGLTCVGNILAPAVLAVAASKYIIPFDRDLNPIVVGMAIVALTTALAILNIRTNAWITGAFLVLELLALAVLAILGFLDVKRSLWEIAVHPVVFSDGHVQTTSIAQIGLAISISLFAYNGYGTAVYFAEEMHEAPRLIGRTIFWALAITVVAELVPVTAVLVGAPDLQAFGTAENPFVDFVTTTGGRLLAIVISLSVALAIFNAVLATILQNARFFYCTGRDGTWHPRINHAFLITHGRFNSPWVATLVAGVSSVALCLLGQDWLLVISGVSIALMYAAVCIAAIVGRNTGATDHAVYRMPLYPFWPVLGLVALAYVICLDAMDPSSGQPSLIINVAAVVAAVGYYAVIVRRKGRFAFRDPAH